MKQPPAPAAKAPRHTITRRFHDSLFIERQGVTYELCDAIREELVTALDSMKGAGASATLLESAKTARIEELSKDPSPVDKMQIKALQEKGLKLMDSIPMLSSALLSAGGKLPGSKAPTPAALAAAAAPVVVPPTRAELAAKAITSVLKLPAPVAKYSDRQAYIHHYDTQQMGNAARIEYYRQDVADKIADITAAGAVPVAPPDYLADMPAIHSGSTWEGYSLALTKQQIAMREAESAKTKSMAEATKPAPEPAKKSQPFSVAGPDHNWVTAKDPEPMPAPPDNSLTKRLASIFTIQ